MCSDLLMGIDGEEGSQGPVDGDGSEESSGSVSRTRQREEAKAVARLGGELIDLSPSVVDKLDLPLELVEAIDLCRRLKLRARARQKRLIAQLLRSEDCDAIRQRMANLGAPRWADIERDKEDERWCALLVSEGDAGLQEFMQAYPESDRGQLRALVRAARQGESSDKKAEKARGKLSKLIASLRSV